MHEGIFTAQRQGPHGRCTLRCTFTPQLVTLKTELGYLQNSSPTAPSRVYQGFPPNSPPVHPSVLIRYGTPGWPRNILGWPGVPCFRNCPEELGPVTPRGHGYRLLKMIDTRSVLSKTKASFTGANNNPWHNNNLKHKSFTRSYRAPRTAVTYGWAEPGWLRPASDGQFCIGRRQQCSDVL